MIPLYKEISELYESNGTIILFAIVLFFCYVHNGHYLTIFKVKRGLKEDE